MATLRLAVLAYGESATLRPFVMGFPSQSLQRTNPSSSILIRFRLLVVTISALVADSTACQMSSRFLSP